ncbi:hypothetical protein SY27_12465 [Flavobacterium sp. 316]|uniref:hypothetical protein n=1 Tax=Flavobacterium sp. 316 TaxID=1603293 RepID=UPI0005E26FB8|nr:hypothetical protein [Flavobacterium sp. 316]KIX20699.1 hypothetical protein SY27_12465 [Flavobacterium sp. 316]
MKNTITFSMVDLKNIGNKFIYSIDQINWWLLKYRDLYKSVVNSQNLLCDECLKLKEENNPINCHAKPDYCNKKTEFEEFIKFYNDLDIVTELHKLEDRCNMAIDEYMTLNCINEDLRDWVIKHYDIYYKIGGYFYLYLKFNEKNVKILHIAETPDESFGIDIREEDFKNSLKFYDVYYELYENKKLYPEKIKEWEELFSKIQLPKDEL